VGHVAVRIGKKRNYIRLYAIVADGEGFEPSMGF
jgi:hypothetical protein